MKLNFNEIVALTTGYVDYAVSDDGITFFRFTKSQYEGYKKQGDVICQNAFAPTGIRLDFHTNSDFLKFSAKNAGNVELLIDGVFVKSAIKGETESEVVLESKLSGDAHVTILLPSHGENAVVTLLELSDGATFTKHKFDKKFLFLGDSVTQGWKSGYDFLSYAYQTTFFYNADSVICGVGGSRFAADTVEKIPEKFSAVFVAYGINDYNFHPTLKDFETEAEKALKKIAALYKKTPKICILPTYMLNEDTVEKSYKAKELRDSLSRIAKENGFTVLDGSKMIPHDNTFYNDSFHPNGLGFMCYANNLLLALAKLKEKAFRLL